jgi:hypothetical protein
MFLNVFYQNPIDGNTILHEVTRLGYINIMKLLPKFDAIRSLYNKKQKISSDLAKTDDIQEIFKRPCSHPRFLFILVEANEIKIGCTIVQGNNDIYSVKKDT